MPDRYPEDSPATPEQGTRAGVRGPEPKPTVVSGEGRIRREALDPDALDVVDRLQHSGHRAYLVGGCVRDLLLGLEPKDFDVATDAVPNRIKRVFRNARIIGRRFRLAHVWFPGGHIVETATFRADPGESGMHPSEDGRPIYSDNVFGTAAEDARRRDFTVNALFYDPFHDEIVDYVGGLQDVDARIIRSIGDPERRILEDPVRMIRAVHFAARMGGEIEPSLLTAIERCAPEIAKASTSRLYVELIKILTRGSARETMRSLFDLGVLDPWLPELCGGLERAIEWPTAPGGTHEAASEGEPENVPASHETWNLLGAADAWGMAPRGVPESLALAVLLGPWLLETWERGPRRGPDLYGHIEEAFRPLALRMSIPKRASFELRDILCMLDRLRHPPVDRHRLRSIVRRPIFPEALAYFGLDLRARDHALTPIDAWHELADEFHGHDPRAARSGLPASDGPPPSRRSRRGRRRRRDEDLTHLDGSPDGPRDGPPGPEPDEAFIEGFHEAAEDRAAPPPRAVAPPPPPPPPPPPAPRPPPVPPQAPPPVAMRPPQPPRDNSKPTDLPFGAGIA